MSKEKIKVALEIEIDEISDMDDIPASWTLLSLQPKHGRVICNTYNLNDIESSIKFLEEKIKAMDSRLTRENSNTNVSLMNEIEVMVEDWEKSISKLIKRVEESEKKLEEKMDKEGRMKYRNVYDELNRQYKALKEWYVLSGRYDPVIVNIISNLEIQALRVRGISQ